MYAAVENGLRVAISTRTTIFACAAAYGITRNIPGKIIASQNHGFVASSSASLEQSRWAK